MINNWRHRRSFVIPVLTLIAFVFSMTFVRLVSCQQTPTNVGKLLKKLSITSSQSEEKIVVGGPCAEAKCLTVFIAPWCPQCKKMLPQLKQLQQELPKQGIPTMIVIGLDGNRERLLTLAKEFSSVTALDTKSSYFDKLPIIGVPYFAVTDKSGKITDDLYGAVEDSSELKKYLNLSSR